MRRRLAVTALAGVMSLIAACSGDAAPIATPPAEITQAPTSAAPVTTALAATTTEFAVEPSVMALSTGRGDDGSMEIVAWLGADPFAGDHRIVVGTDADDSFPGVGDPAPHLDAFAEMDGGVARMVDGPETVASGAAAQEWVSWGWSEGVLRVFFIQASPARSGTVWLIVEPPDGAVVGGTAGVPFGESCSYHGSGIPIEASGIPDEGSPCRYPMG